MCSSDLLASEIAENRTYRYPVNVRLGLLSERLFSRIYADADMGTAIQTELKKIRTEISGTARVKNASTAPCNIMRRFIQIFRMFFFSNSARTLKVIDSERITSVFPVRTDIISGI